MTTSPADFRIYVHSECGRETRVSGGDYEMLANPFVPVSETMCAACGRAAPIGKFRWADSDEAIDVCRRRLRKTIPRSRRLVYAALGPLIGLTLSLPIGYFVLGRGAGQMPLWVGTACGGIAGFMIGAQVFTPLLLRRFFKVDFRDSK